MINVNNFKDVLNKFQQVAVVFGGGLWMQQVTFALAFSTLLIDAV